MELIRELVVFLASPTDVAAERMAAEEVVAAVNRLVRRLGWRVALQKWEDSLPGYGRPQTLINPLVDECDLFVGLLWERWGQPSGRFSSGFEEEYERARARRAAEGKPEIWLVFKKVDPTKLKDPGDQLKRVLEFRESLTNRDELLYREVRDADDWKVKFKDWLLEHTLSIAPVLPEAPQQPASLASVSELPDASVIGPAAEGSDRGAIPQQLRTLAASLVKAFRERVPNFFAPHGNQLQEFDVARLHLLSATLMSHRYTRDVLGTHDINLLYKHRHELDATSDEYFLIFRTIVEDIADVKPGWYWCQDIDEQTVRNVLFDLASEDSSANVRARALDLLTAARIQIPRGLWQSLPMHDDSLAVRQSALNYVVNQADEHALSFLIELSQGNDPVFSSAVEDARFEVLACVDPARALSEVIEKGEYISDRRMRPLLGRISEADEQTLLKGTGSSWEPMRKLSAEELMRRGKLTTALAQTLAGDPSLAVRAIALSSLAARGEVSGPRAIREALKESANDSASKGKPFLGLGGILGGREAQPRPDVDSIVVAFYRSQPAEYLLAEVDWFSIDGPLAYRVLASDRFDSISTHLRSDLLNGFVRIKEESLKSAEREFGPEGAKRLAAGFGRFDDFIRSQFAKAALLGLAKNGQRSDAELARQYLTQTDNSVRDAAVAVMSRFGDGQDASALLKVAKEAYGDVKQHAAAGAMKLSNAPLAVARELMLSTDPEVVRLAFDWMFGQYSAEVREIFEELLNDGNEANRIRSLYYLSKKPQDPDLEKLLASYIAQGKYFYNVVTWLDRLLYAPSPLKDMFTKDLERKGRQGD